MRTFTRISFCLSGMLLAITSYAQGPLGVLPMQFNSSFAGEAHSPRFSSAAAYWDNNPNPNTCTACLPHAFMAISYDQFVPAIRSGIGITAGWNGISNENVRTAGYGFQLAVAPKFSIQGKYTLSPSLDFSYHESNDSYKSTVHSPAYSTRYEKIGSRLGFLLNTNRYYVGLSFNLVNLATFTSENYRNRTNFFRSEIQLGYTFQRSDESRFSFTPQLALLFSRFYWNDRIGLQDIGMNCTFRYQQFIWGVHWLGYHLGWQTERLRLILGNNLIFKHEERANIASVSFRYIFANRYTSRW
jgi:hypothetical protein